jgi:hypothetical protein
VSFYKALYIYFEMTSKILINEAGSWWFRPVTLATWEAEMGRITVQGQGVGPEHKVQETPSQQKKQLGTRGQEA